MTIKDSKYIRSNKVNPLFLIINKVNGYIKKINGNKYLTLLPSYESRKIIKKYEELWSKIRDLIRSVIKINENKI